MRVSIITPTIDSAGFIDEAIRSVPSPTNIDVEHIVVHDGGEAFLDALRQKYPRLRTMRGPGCGPGPAVAAAIAAASGDFILQLNSDDRMGKGCLAQLVLAASARPDIRVWTGRAQIFRALSDGEEFVLRQIDDREVTRLSLGNILDDLPLLTARFIHRSVFAQIGNLDPRFPYSNDREFLLRAVIAGIADAPLDAVVSEMRQHDASRTIHRRRGWIPPYLAEHLMIADQCLGRIGLSPQSRRALLNWRAREALRLAVFQMRVGQAWPALRMIVGEQRKDPFWVARAATSLAAWQRRRR